MADVTGLEQTLEQQLAELAHDLGVVGAVVAVRSGDTVIEAATGTANLNIGAPVTTSTVFQLGSISKVYTTTLVMQLVDEGLVDLDAPVRTYLPEFALADESAAETITVRHLLCHVSGIDGDIFDDFGRGDDCVEKFVLAMADLEQTNEPRAFFSYCNSGFVLLGRLVEALRGLSWDDALAKHLLAPLGVTDTVTLPEQAILRDNAVGHLPTGPDGAPEVAPAWFLSRSSGPAGVVTATARDLLSFVRMHLSDGTAADGTQVLSPASVKAMQQIQVEQPDPHTLGEGWGLGWILYRFAGDDSPAVIGHDGSTIGNQAYCRVVPDKDFSIALVTNGGPGGALFNALVRPLLATYADATLVEPATPPQPPVDIDVTPFLGTYERSGVRMAIRRDDGGGLVLDTTPTGPLADMLPAEPPEPLVVLDETRLITAEPAERLGTHIVMKFLGAGPDGFGHVHMGGRATPRVRTT
jgi:CubicO group peptidase (beta-lactamase class C family)